MISNMWPAFSYSSPSYSKPTVRYTSLTLVLNHPSFLLAEIGVIDSKSVIYLCHTVFIHTVRYIMILFLYLVQERTADPD